MVTEVSANDSDRFDTFLRWANVGVTPTYNMISSIWPFARERNLCFDNEVNELSLKIPPDIRGAGVLHKWILYHLSKIMIIIPDANSFMPPLFPRHLSDISIKMRPFVGQLRRKLIDMKRRVENKSSDTLALKTSGSWIFLHELYRKNPQYKEQIEDLIFDNHIFSPEIFDLTQIQQIWGEYLGGEIRFHLEIESLRSFGSLNKLITCNDIDL